MDDTPSQELIVIEERRGVIASLESACQSLALAKDIPLVKDIRDRMQAIAHYAREAGLGKQAIDDACELKLRAEKRLGELLAEMPKQAGARGVCGKAESHRATPPTLADIGINKHESSRCQKIAGIPEGAFDDRIKEARLEGEELTTAMMLRLAAELNKADQSEKQFNVLLERDAIEKLLLGRVEKWPEGKRHFFPQILEQITEKLQRQCDDRRGPWSGCAAEGEDTPGAEDSR